ncbi:uncharacterized protein BJ171DRAFT_473018 [Polychytrium aggregatum]|uniref:uncharacterized protein n=1 Tax=Polychytrium aggregatum TaxID=110093 RepID=UPI0022FEF8BE|nr:uncharacterized protein BJ171DRAFT_473018 [Polychytrium aggregatum]KAI9207049.1 hypothetical protein BJ171DRAFT_473018 [Polychytrium aggregatum]
MVQPLLPTVPSSKKKKHPSAKRLDAAEPDWAPKMDFSKVSDRILKKYKRTYSIKIKAKETPEELVGSVTKHFHSQVVSERDVLPYFLYCIHNQGRPSIQVKHR